MTKTTTLTIEQLRDAVAGNAAAVRLRLRLQPAGGPGTKVFPPTYQGGVYAVEKRHAQGKDEKPREVSCVLLDSRRQLFLGWTESQPGRRSCVQQLKDMKIKMLIEVYPAPTYPFVFVSHLA
jgi:hypothetical protein